MFNTNLIVLSYHRFTHLPGEYQYSRTYAQLARDIKTKVFDWITIDDGHESINHIFRMLHAQNIRAKIFVSTALIGTPGYCTWKDLKQISDYHDIENHAHEHVNLQELSYKEVEYSITLANEIIEKHIGKRPRYFVPPFNKYDENVTEICSKLNLTLCEGRL